MIWIPGRYRKEYEGHPLARLYQTLGQIYREAKAEADLRGAELGKFRMILLDKQRVKEAGVVADPAIHPHRHTLDRHDPDLRQVAQVYYDDAGNLPPGEDKGIWLTGKQGRIAYMPWCNPNIDRALFPLLFPRGQLAYQSQIRLSLEEGENVARRRKNEVEDLDIDATDPNNQQDDLGEEEQLMRPELEDEYHPRMFVSRAQWIRYMLQIRGKEGWKSPSWIWWAGALAQLYILTQCNRLESDKIQWIKKHVQKDLRSALPGALIAAFQKLIEERAGTFFLIAYSAVKQLHF